MARSVYVAGVEGFTGKSAVALGVLEQLSRRVARVAVFRPVVRAEASTGDVHDYVLDLLVSHDAVSLSYDECAGVSYDDVHADPDGAMDRIVARYHQVAEQSDAVVIVGSDYTDVGAPAEFAFNARVAANLGAPVLLVLNGQGRGVDQLCTAAAMAQAELAANHATLFAVIANRVDPEATDRTAAALRREGVPAFALPEQPLLSAPSVGDLMAACNGRLVRGDETQLAREVPGLVVAAMTLPNVLDRLFDGALVVTPGDRPEVVLGVLTAHQSASFPQISGIVLNGGLDLPEQIDRLLDGLEVALPIIATDLGTHATSTTLTNRRGRLDKDSPAQDRDGPDALRRARRRRGADRPASRWRAPRSSRR